MALCQFLLPSRYTHPRVHPKMSGIFLASPSFPINPHTALTIMRKLWFVFLSIPVAILLAALLSNQSKLIPADGSNTYPADDWLNDNHIHAIALDYNNKYLFVGTHRGLVHWANGQWSWASPPSFRPDFMAMDTSKSAPGRIAAGGHPGSGGNLGFIASKDNGKTFKMLSMQGVDFHAMSISPLNPDIIYVNATSGKQGLFFTTDGGRRGWEKMAAHGLPDAPFHLEALPHAEGSVLALTATGAFRSDDYGATFSRFEPGPDGVLTSVDRFEENGNQFFIASFFDESSKKTDFYRSSTLSFAEEDQVNANSLNGLSLHLAAHPQGYYFSTVQPSAIWYAAWGKPATRISPRT